MKNDLISRSALRTLAYHVTDNIIGVERCVVDWDDIEDAPAVDAVEVTAQELQFLIDALYRHIRWMIAGRLDKPECSFDERVALSEKLRQFEREHFPDMQAETEG